MGIRESYDAVAGDYAMAVASELPHKIFDRAMIGGFAELVLAEEAGTVADIGCGPGHLTAYLAELGLHVRGIDLSTGMIEVAREAHPSLRFDVQSMTSLDVDSSSLAGVVARYSLIHFSPDELLVALAELARVVRLGGYLLIDFQVGDEHVSRTEAYGHVVSFTSYRRTPEYMASAIEGAGFEVVAVLTRAPAGGERVQQCHLIARRTAGLPDRRTDGQTN